MASTPTRAGAGAAGVAGAILAAGVVLFGTHVTTWLHSSTPSHLVSTRPIDIGSSAPLLVTTTTAAITTLGPVKKALSILNRSLVRIRSTRARGVGLGDGLIVSSAGYVAAPASLVADASSITVIRSDGEQLIATVRGVDPTTGLAVLHIDEGGVPAVGFANQVAPSPASFDIVGWRRGTAVHFALATAGSMTTHAGTGAGPALLLVCPSSLDLLSAPTGAVVLNGAGQVVSFVTTHRDHAALAASGWLAGRVIHDLIATGRVEHGWLGIKGTATTYTQAASRTAGAVTGMRPNSTSAARGVKVVSVTPGSAAARAGLTKGDVIASVNDQHVASMSSLQADLYLMKPASTVKLGVVRDHQISWVSARLQPAA